MFMRKIHFCNLIENDTLKKCQKQEKGLNLMKMNSAFLKYLVALLLFGSNGFVASHILLASNEIVFFRTLIGSAFCCCSL